MLVFVNKKNVEPHYTVLLAVKYAGWRTKVVFYDPFNDLIKVEKMWQPSNNYSKRAFYILKESNEWIKSNKWIGFDWIINEINKQNVFKKHKFSSQSNHMAREKYNWLVVNEWNEYILAICLVIKESKNKKYYLKVLNDSFEISYPNLTNKGEVLTVKFTDIEKIDYYKMISFVSWLAVIQMQCPKALFITYYTNNRKEEKAIGHAELKDIVKICEEKKIKLIIH